MPDKNESAPFVIGLKFVEVELPKFRKHPGKPYVRLGLRDDWADKLLQFRKQSAKHNAIINGKVKYIYGGGLVAETPDPGAEAWLQAVNRTGESLGEVLRRSIDDTETHGGFYWHVITDGLGRITDIFHIEFGKIRRAPDLQTFYFKHDWRPGWEGGSKEEAKPYPAFNPRSNRAQSAIYYFDEYRPGCMIYPEPGYMGGLNWIAADCELGRHTLTNAVAGFSASKLLTFMDGAPNEEGKRKLEDRLHNKYTGADGKKIFVAFTNDKDHAPTVQDLGTSDLSKEDFTAVDNLICSNIYAGHEITTPALFGISQAGKLGETKELRDGYQIFNNTYAAAKRQQYEEILNKFAALKGIRTRVTIKPVEPIGIEITDTLVQSALTQDEIRGELGYAPKTDEDPGGLSRAINGLSPLVANKVIESMTQNEIRSIAGLPPKEGGDVLLAPTGAAAPANTAPEGMADEGGVNQHIKNLDASQRANMDRIVRKWRKGEYDRERAAWELTTGLGLSDEDIAMVLRPLPVAPAAAPVPAAPQQMSAALDEAEIAGLFAEAGHSKEGFEVLRSEAFEAGSDKDVVELEMALRLSFVEQFAEEPKHAPTGTPPAAIPPTKIILPKVEVRYSYEKNPKADGPSVLDTTRPFCKKLVELDRYYTRQQIEAISERVGYSVWDRRGGFWNQGDKTTPYCRHIWKMNLVTKNTDA